MSRPPTVSARTRESTPQNAARYATGAAAVMDDPAEMETMEILASPEWQLARRVAESGVLGKSELLPRFLLHVCETTLRGRAHDLAEQRIGHVIFHRPPDYNPGEDNIVRSYARLLRKRLDEYFAGPGAHEPVRILIPRGGYVPQFHPVIAKPEEESTQPLEESSAAEAIEPSSPATAMQTVPSSARSAPLPVWAYTILGVLIGMLLSSALWLRWSTAQAAKETSPAHALWLQMFQPSRDTLIVPADAGLGIIQNLSHREISIGEYANGSYLAELNPPAGLDAGNFNDLRRQRYTSIADLTITAKLTRLPEFIPNRTEVRYSRSLTAEDLKGANIILLGSKHSNPWEELFEKRMNFRFEYAPTVDDSWIVNENPQGSEQKLYRNGADDSSSRTFGTIAYLPGPDGNNHVLVIQGLNMAATQAAAEILFNADMIRPVLQQMALPNGHLRPFELLIETTSIGAAAPGAQIIATRRYDP